ncbi:hypothetical protein [Campylobacter armoricus]|uniref:hypothetical protein n=1 Tax=Campylobacter armoricus TaxID=2505970 RepID=UPI00111723D6|nr:hypothetical protein [Campylobacter armoricus]
MKKNNIFYFVCGFNFSLIVFFIFIVLFIYFNEDIKNNLLQIFEVIQKIGIILIGSLGSYFGYKQLRLSMKNTNLSILKNETDIFTNLSEKNDEYNNNVNKLIKEYNDTCSKKEFENEELKLILEKIDLEKRKFYYYVDMICLYVLEDFISKDRFYQQCGGMLEVSKNVSLDEFGYKNIEKLLQTMKNIKIL